MAFFRRTPALPNAVRNAASSSWDRRQQRSRAMGDKLNARRLAVEAGMPVVPGTPSGLGRRRLARSGASIGYPLLVKASAGGGGIGMSVARDESQLVGAMRTARSRAGRAFGNDVVFFELFSTSPATSRCRYSAIKQARRAPVRARVLGPAEVPEGDRGSAFAGGDPALREQLTDAALNVARRIGYTSAGTIECMLDAQRAFYFLEMNTRLQVEHPITEATVTLASLPLDLVEWRDPQCDAVKQLPVRAGRQSRSAAGRSRRGSTPRCPTRASLRRSAASRATTRRRGEGVRVDSGVDAASTVTPHYDSLLAKVIAAGRDAADRARPPGRRVARPSHRRRPHQPAAPDRRAAAAGVRRAADDALPRRGVPRRLAPRPGARTRARRQRRPPRGSSPRVAATRSDRPLDALVGFRLTAAAGRRASTTVLGRERRRGHGLGRRRDRAAGRDAGGLPRRRRDVRVRRDRRRCPGGRASLSR